MRLNSLAVRLIAASTIWMTVALPLAGFLIYRLYRDEVQADFDARLEKLVNAVALLSMSTEGPEPVVPNNLYEPLFEETLSGFYWQVRPLDNPAARTLVSASLATGSLESPLAANVAPTLSGVRWLNGVGPDGGPIRMAEVVDTLNHAAGAPRYSVIATAPLDWLESRISNFAARLATALTLAGLGLLTVTLFQVRFGLLPLRRIERGLQAIRTGEAQSLEGELPQEIEPLQNELNALITSNQDIVDRARTQVGNLAHALKTPLAVIINEARDDKGPFAKKVAEQAELMRDQVTRYLDRARMAARIGAISRSTDIAPVLEPIIRALERIHRDKAVSITADVPAKARFQGEKQDLEEMLGNILDNAAKWARKSVYVTVEESVREKRSQPPRVVIRVDDDGPGLSADERAKIGKRGLRLDETKPGSGLGLSIVLDLVQSYRGSLALDQSPHGGLRVEIELPAV